MHFKFHASHFPLCYVLCLMCAAQKKECKKNVLFWCNVARSHNLNAMPHISLYFMSYVLFVQPQKGVQEDCFVLVQGRDMTHSKFHASHFPLCCVLCLMCATAKKRCAGRLFCFAARLQGHPSQIPWITFSPFLQKRRAG